MLADSVGLALLVVLDRLAPAERVAFVLHDMFGVPFEEIAGITGRSSDAARQLASRARRRVQGAAGQDGQRLPASRGAGRPPPGGWPGSGRSPRRSSPPPGQATATRCWPCSTRTSSCTRTRPRRRPAGRRSCGARRRWPTGRGCPASGRGTRSSSSWTGCPASCTRRAARSRSCSPSATATTAISGIEVIADAGRLDALELAVLD